MRGCFGAPMFGDASAALCFRASGERNIFTGLVSRLRRAMALLKQERERETESVSGKRVAPYEVMLRGLGHRRVKLAGNTPLTAYAVLSPLML